MKKVQSLQRRSALFGAAAVVLLAVVVLRPSETSIVRSADMPLLFPKFEKDMAQARQITIDRVPVPKKESATTKEKDASSTPEAKRLELAKRGDAWVLSSAFDHATRENAAQALLDALARVRAKDVLTDRADTFASYADDKGWTRVEVKDGAGQTLASVSVGKSWPDVYLLVDEGGAKPRVVRTSRFETDVASTDTTHWIDTAVWPMLGSTQIARLDVEQRRDQRTLSFERGSPDAKPAEPAKEGEAPKPPLPAEPSWKMLSPKEGEAIRDDVDGLVRSFSGLRAKDVVAGSTNAETDKKFGLDDPELVLTGHEKPAKDGGEPVKHVLEVGKKVEGGDDWYVRRKGQSWVYVVSHDDLDPFRKDPDSFLIKKDEPKKEPPTTPEGSPDGDGK